MKARNRVFDGDVVAEAPPLGRPSQRVPWIVARGHSTNCRSARGGGKVIHWRASGVLRVSTIALSASGRTSSEMPPCWRPKRKGGGAKHGSVGGSWLRERGSASVVAASEEGALSVGLGRDALRQEAQHDMWQ